MIIDAHMHYADDDPDFLALLAEFDLKFLNICFVRDPAEDSRNASPGVPASTCPRRLTGILTRPDTWRVC